MQPVEKLVLRREVFIQTRNHPQTGKADKLWAQTEENDELNSSPPTVLQEQELGLLQSQKRSNWFYPTHYAAA